MYTHRSIFRGRKKWDMCSIMCVWLCPLYNELKPNFQTSRHTRYTTKVFIFFIKLTKENKLPQHCIITTKNSLYCILNIYIYIYYKSCLHQIRRSLIKIYSKTMQQSKNLIHMRGSCFFSGDLHPCVRGSSGDSIIIVYFFPGVN